MTKQCRNISGIPQVVRVREGIGARRPRSSSQQCVGPRNRWTVRVDPATVTSQRTNQHTGVCGTLPCDPGRTDAYLEKRCGERYAVSLPAHHPTVAWLVKHCAWLHDRFVMKRQDKQTLFSEADGKRLSWCRHPHF